MGGVGGSVKGGGVWESEGWRWGERGAAHKAVARGGGVGGMKEAYVHRAGAAQKIWES